MRLSGITKKYKLRQSKYLRDWLNIYNTYVNFKTGSGGSQMSQSRKTTFIEQVKAIQSILLVSVLNRFLLSNQMDLKFEHFYEAFFIKTNMNI